MFLKSLFRKKSAYNLSSEEGHGHGLNKVLTVRDLTFFGIAAIIGGGTFSAIGSACYSGGPGVIILYIICAVACGFTAMCYAEFAARVPVSGSAYTYAYVSFGEMFAWIIGWALLMEYSIGNIYIAFSWSGYFTNLLDGIGVHLPAWLTINYSEAHQHFLNTQEYMHDASAYLANNSAHVGTVFSDWLGSADVKESLAAGKSLSVLAADHQTAMIAKEGYQAFSNAPLIGSLRFVIDLPAFLINALITMLVYMGTKESRNASNAMVIIKLAIIALIIIVGIFYIDIDNWTPFMPNGFGGVMAAVSGVFFAYIGFDAVSTLAEESKNPQRDLPRGMILSLIICTVVFIILCLVLTGMASYTLLGVSDPLAEIFKIKGVKWMLFIVSIAAVVAMTSVLLVFQMGQPRIWMSMSRDGLLPKKFASIHPKYKTPGFSTIVTGLVVGIPIFFTNETFVLDFTSIGTLFAFVLVCGGILMLPRREKSIETQGKFLLPFLNAKFVMPFLVAIAATILIIFNPNFFSNLFVINADTAATNIPMIIFLALCVMLTIYSFVKELSLIPVLGLLSCCYLLTGMTPRNWAWFFGWLVIGLIVYFLYGYRKSKLAVQEK